MSFFKKITLKIGNMTTKDKLAWGTVLILLIVFLYTAAINSPTFQNFLGLASTSGTSGNGGNGCAYDDFVLTCIPDTRSVSTSESVVYTANVNRGNAGVAFNWHTFSMSTSTGVILSVTATKDRCSKTVQCEHVSIHDSELYRNGDKDHSCRVLLVNGVNSQPPHFSDFSKERIAAWTYTKPSSLGGTNSINRCEDGSDHGSDHESEKGACPFYNVLRVRAMIPENDVITLDNSLEIEDSISDSVDVWSRDPQDQFKPNEDIKVALVAAHSLGAIASYNYSLLGISPQLPLTYKLYDPPYNVIKAPWVVEWLGRLVGFDWATNSSRIKYAVKQGIVTSPNLVAAWSDGLNGLKYSDTDGGRALMRQDHVKYVSTPSELNAIPEWVENNCPHMCLPGARESNTYKCLF